MVRQIYIRPSWLAIVLIMIAIIIVAFNYKPNQESAIRKELQQNTEVKQTVSLTQFKNAKENENCLKCHGQSKYSYENPEQGKAVNKRMYSELIIQPDLLLYLQPQAIQMYRLPF